MSDFFHRQLAAYAGYHRDERNGLTHFFGIPILFLAVLLPFCLCRVMVFGSGTCLAPLVATPALFVWLWLDAAIGLAIVAGVAMILVLAATIVSYLGVLEVWIVAAALFVVGWALQIAGHALFEERKPAFVDNPVHLLIGPMFVVAKLFVAAGLRRDLAAVMGHDSRDAPIRSLR